MFRHLESRGSEYGLSVETKNRRLQVGDPGYPGMKYTGSRLFVRIKV